jgi:hypothetical protein
MWVGRSDGQGAMDLKLVAGPYDDADRKGFAHSDRLQVAMSSLLVKMTGIIMKIN